MLKIVYFGLLKDKETQHNLNIHIHLSNCGLKNRVTRFFNSLKCVRQFFPLRQNFDTRALLIPTRSNVLAVCTAW
jgi:hypothetical protein